jgi:hypothetical protein
MKKKRILVNKAMELQLKMLDSIKDKVNYKQCKKDIGMIGFLSELELKDLLKELEEYNELT